MTHLVLNPLARHLHGQSTPLLLPGGKSHLEPNFRKVINDDVDVLHHCPIDPDRDSKTYPGKRLICLLLTYIDNKGTLGILVSWSRTSEDRYRWARQIGHVICRVPARSLHALCAAGTPSSLHPESNMCPFTLSTWPESAMHDMLDTGLGIACRYQGHPSVYGWGNAHSPGQLISFDHSASRLWTCPASESSTSTGSCCQTWRRRASAA